MLNHFTFNGHSTGELGLLVSGINIYGSPSRVVEKVNIPYRSGDLLIDTGAYTNYMLTYTVDIMDNTKATAEAISKWLLGSKGYCELTDTYNPEIYRVASYYNQLDYTLSALYRYGKATITFDCKPQKYLMANQPVSLSSTLSEETSYSLSTPAMPLPITLEGNTTQGENPTPEAPQQIHSVKGDNEIRVVGKNLIPITATTQTLNGVTFTVNGDGTVRANGTATASFSFNFFYRGSGIENGIPLTAGTTYVLSTADMQYFPINIQIMRNGQPIAVSSNSPFTAQEGDYVSLVWVWRQSGTVFNNALFSPQFEVGSTPTAFEPYKAQVYPINLGSIELNALGTYKDYFHKANGKWYLHKAIQKYVLDGTNTMFSGAWGATTNGYSVYYSLPSSDAKNINDKCNKFVAVTNSYGNMPLYSFVGSSGAYQTVSFILPSSVTNVATANTWLTQNNLEWLHCLETPTETEITNSTLISQLNALSKAKTYDGSTTIVQEGTDAQFKLSMPVPAEISSNYFGEPIITVNEVGTIVWNDSLIKVNSAPVTINSQTLQCYYYSQNKNNDVEINEFPKYEQGENYIGSTMALTVVPNYWKL